MHHAVNLQNSVLPRGNGLSGEKGDLTVYTISRSISESRLRLMSVFVVRKTSFPVAVVLPL